MSGRLVKRIADRAKQNNALRRVLIPLLTRFPGLRRRIAMLRQGRERDIVHPDWPAPLPAVYLRLPLPTRKILLDLARASGRDPTLRVPSHTSRLAWVAPYRPNTTQVILLGELAQRYDIDLIIPHLNENDGIDTETGLRIRGGTWFSMHHQHFERVLYHVDNSPAYAPVLSLLACHPGIVFMHDFSLGEAVVNMPLSLHEALYHAHGYSGLLAARGMGEGATLSAFPLNRLVFDYASGILVEPDGAEAMCEKARACYGPHSAHWIHPVSTCADDFAAAVEHIGENSAVARYHRSVRDLASCKIATDPRKASLIAMAQELAAKQPSSAPRQLLVDISALVDNDLKTGIQRVVRSILLALIKDPPEGFRVEPVYGTSLQQRYRYARRYTLTLLGIDPDSIAAVDDPISYQAGDIYLGLDLSAHSTVNNLDMLDDMRAQGIAVHFVVYDMLPILQPDAFPYGTGQSFDHYMLAVSQHADGLVCISRAVADEVCNWIGRQNVPRPTPIGIAHFHLGADLDASAPSTGMPAAATQVLAAMTARPSFLMVGTLEPRKAHAQALAAFDLLWQDGVDVNLVIVGKQGWMVDEVAAALRAHPRLDNKLFWLPGVSDQMLTEVYHLATALLAASSGEGFGLPLIEAAQHGVPIIARSLPVFREVSGEHAFFFDGTEPGQLADAIKRWLDLYRDGLAPSSASMPWLTWSSSARQLLDAIVHNRWYRTLSD